MAEWMKMQLLYLWHFNHISGKMTFGTKADNGSRATYFTKQYYPLGMELKAEKLFTMFKN